MSLFSIDNSDILYIPLFLKKPQADECLQLLTNELAWQQENITMFGKQITVPRKVCWMAEHGVNYSYSGNTYIGKGWHKRVLSIKAHIESETALELNSVLANYYRDGRDYMGWHSDNEKELGRLPVIASISLGAERKFQFRLNEKGSTIHNITLQHGSLLLMKSGFQEKYKHQLPKAPKCLQPRINLTFRKVLI